MKLWLAQRIWWCNRFFYMIRGLEVMWLLTYIHTNINRYEKYLINSVSTYSCLILDRNMVNLTFHVEQHVNDWTVLVKFYWIDPYPVNDMDSELEWCFHSRGGEKRWEKFYDSLSLKKVQTYMQKLNIDQISFQV